MPAPGAPASTAPGLPETGANAAAAETQAAAETKES
jgi:hypothetical protein